MALTMNMFQVKIGIRNMVIPGARRQKTVVMRFTAVRIEATPVTTTPMIHRSAPDPGEWMASDSGVYAVQPN